MEKYQTMLPSPIRHGQHAFDGDEPIRQTDVDAAIARLSAVRKGYIHDPYIRHFVPRLHLQQPRPPLINVGTFLRGCAIDQLVNQWLAITSQANQGCQIVSLGAGSDTRFWRVATGPFKEHLASYIEIDFPEVTTKKAMAIRKSKELWTVLSSSPNDIQLAQGGTALHAPNYHLLPADLRLHPSETLGSLLTSQTPNSGPILSSSLSTLLLFECILVYMSPSASDAILKWFFEYFSTGKAPLGAIVYEMFGLQDAFGRVMLENLKTRNVSLPGAEPYPNQEELPKRFSRVGYTRAYALTLREIRRRIAPTELERLSTLEMLDEIEELDLVLEHYAVTWGIYLPVAELHGSWSGWGLAETI